MDRKHQIFNFKGERINLKKKLLTYIACDNILSKNFLIEVIVVKRHMSS